MYLTVQVLVIHTFINDVRNRTSDVSAIPWKFIWIVSPVSAPYRLYRTRSFISDLYRTYNCTGHTDYVVSYRSCSLYRIRIGDPNHIGHVVLYRTRSFVYWNGTFYCSECSLSAESVLCSTNLCCLIELSMFYKRCLSNKVFCTLLLYEEKLLNALSS